MLISRGLRSIAQTLRGFAPQGKPLLPHLRLKVNLCLPHLYSTLISKPQKNGLGLVFLSLFKLRRLTPPSAAKPCATRKMLRGVRFAPLVSLRYARVRALRALGGSSSLRLGKGKPRITRLRLKVNLCLPHLYSTLIPSPQKKGVGLGFASTCGVFGGEK